MSNILDNTALFNDIDVSVSVDLSEDQASREVGFDAVINELDLVNPNEGIVSEEILSEGIAGNLYYNFHTNDFGAGELRGQLDLTRASNHRCFGNSHYHIYGFSRWFNRVQR